MSPPKVKKEGGSYSRNWNGGGPKSILEKSYICKIFIQVMEKMFRLRKSTPDMGAIIS